MRSCNANVTDIASCVCMELRVPVAFAIKVSLLAKSWPEGHLVTTSVQLKIANE